MFDFHQDKPRYFQMQYLVSKNYVIPFLESAMTLDKTQRILEIGCAEAGVLKAFTERGHTCMGIELNAERVKLAKGFFEKELKDKQIRFLSKNIYDIDPKKDIDNTFDIILLKDVIEHIHDQNRFIQEVKRLLNPNGKIFFGFPPWQMPFGGHQQILKNKYLSKLPYFHLLPKPIYKGMIKMGGATNGTVANMIEIKDTGISIDRFERILKQNNYRTLNKKLWLFNPIYEYKFNLKPRPQNKLVGSIPVVRNFLSTCAYYLVEPVETSMT